MNAPRAPRIVSGAVAQLVEEYVSSELSDKAKYDNRTPLDESGIWSLHTLAATIYALAFNDGARVEATRNHAERMRAQEAVSK